MMGSANYCSVSGEVVGESWSEPGLFGFSLLATGRDDEAIVPILVTGKRVPLVMALVAPGARIAVWGRLVTLRDGGLGMSLDWIEVMRGRA